MEYLHSDLGHCHRGDVVEVTLTRGANIRLLDTTNFHRYRRGERHTYHGGLAKRSPATVVVPHAGRWYVVVDIDGLAGSTRATFRLIRSRAA